MTEMAISSNNRKPPSIILPAAVWFFLFLVIPLGIVLLFSFMQKGAYGRIDFTFGFSNYLRSFEAIYLKIIARSLLLATYTTWLCLVLAFPLSYLMARASKAQKRLFLALVIIPFWTNFVIRIYALKLVLGETGLLNRWLMNAGLISTPLVLVNNEIGVAIGMVYNYLPFMILPLYVTLEKLDFTLLDAAYDLGATRWQLLYRILLPLSSPGIVTGSLFVFIPAFGEFVIPDLMGGSQAMYVGSLITETFLKTRDWPFGSALSSFLVLFALLAFLVANSRAEKTEAARAH